MTVVGAGGVRIDCFRKTRRFAKEYAKLDPIIRGRCDDRLEKLLLDPRPPGLGFEKLEGYSNPDLYTIHINGNFKVSMEIRQDPNHGCVAILRHVARHDLIDRSP
jgi:hypothetical protein